MKQVPYISILLVLLFASNSITHPVQDENLPNGFLVKFKPDINPEAIRAKNILQADYGMREGEYELTYNTIEIPTICKIITAIVRNNRFCDGALVSQFESGLGV
jgi:hypothetical protein